MSMASDPVCGMDVGGDGETFATEYGGKKFYFCSFACQSEFERNPERYSRGSKALTVSEIMGTEVPVVKSDESALEAAKLMAGGARGCVLVEESGRSVGIITERDLINKVLAENLSPANIQASDVMTSQLVVAAPETTIEDASKTMAQHSIRRLPVVKDGALVGLVTADDIAMQVAKERDFKDHRINALARYCVSPTAPPYG